MLSVIPDRPNRPRGDRMRTLKPGILGPEAIKGNCEKGETRPVRIWGRVRVCLRPFRFITFFQKLPTFILDNHPTEHTHLSVADAASIIARST